MVYFKENYYFPSFQKGSNILQWVGVGGGGVQLLIPYRFYSIEIHITCDFPGGGGGGGGFQVPCPPPSRSAHVQSF